MSAPGSDEVRESRKWRLGRLVAVGTAAVTGVGYVVGDAMAWIVNPGHHLWWPWVSIESNQLYDVVRSDVAAVALIGAGGAALLSYRRQRTAEQQHQLDTRRHGLSESADLREQYTNAAEQIGHDKAAVRLAGVYAMAGLADTWSRRGNAGQRQVCIDVLCAYLRISPDEDDAAEKQVRSTIIRLIQQHCLNPNDASTWSDARIDLTSAELVDVDLSGCTFAGEVTFDRASFDGSILELARCTISGSVSFTAAEVNATRADFSESRFQRGSVVAFQDVKFTGGWVDFRGTVFAGSRTSFTGAEFRPTLYTTFARAQFIGGLLDFSRAHFEPSSVGLYWKESYTDFSEAIFASGAMMSYYATYRGEVRLIAAKFLRRMECTGARFKDCDLLISGLSCDAPAGALDLSQPTEWNATLVGLPVPAGVELPAWAPAAE